MWWRKPLEIDTVWAWVVRYMQVLFVLWDHLNCANTLLKNCNILLWLAWRISLPIKWCVCIFRFRRRVRLRKRRGLFDTWRWKPPQENTAGIHSQYSSLPISSTYKCTHSETHKQKPSMLTQPHCMTLDEGIMLVSYSPEVKTSLPPTHRTTWTENSVNPLEWFISWCFQTFISVLNTSKCVVLNYHTAYL